MDEKLKQEILALAKVQEDDKDSGVRACSLVLKILKNERQENPPLWITKQSAAGIVRWSGRNTRGEWVDIQIDNVFGFLAEHRVEIRNGL